MAAIVTGAARGIGAAIALRLAKDGHSVALLDRRPLQAMSEVVAPIEQAGGHAAAFGADLADPPSLLSAVAEVQARLGPVDVLVNNAGVSRTDEIRELTFEQAFARWRELLTINLDGTFAMCAAVIPGLIERGYGRIVNLASSSVLTSTPGMTAYMASKGGIIGLTSGLANDLGRFGITVNAVSPGMTRTPAVAEDILAGRLPADVMEGIVARQAIPREGTPDDLAGLVAFLCGREASFITGQFIVADGGMTRH